VDGIGFDEIVASAAEPDGSGRVVVIPADHPAGPIADVPGIYFGVSGQNLGIALAAGDYNADMLDDLLIHVPGYSDLDLATPEQQVLLVLGRSDLAGIAVDAAFDVGVHSTVPFSSGLLDYEIPGPLGLLDAVKVDYAAILDWNGDRLSDIMFGQVAQQGVGVASPGADLFVYEPDPL
jgi:hypothetical protein